jgi:hypothetical protein
MGVFTVEYLHEFPHFNVSEVLYLSGVSFIGALVSLPFLGKMLERFGCKPVLFVTRIALGPLSRDGFWSLPGSFPANGASFAFSI